MGVVNLWQILAPVQRHTALSELSGQTLAVDLSVWVCEAQGVKHMHGVVTKPHLRNLFFRISQLMQMGIKLVFAIEGSAPELKQEAMMKRQQARFGEKSSGAKMRKPGRSNFTSLLRECCELLEHLGVPYIQSCGEAEAMCALLNAERVVDGCLTDDGDAFLYGARKVYRNFTLNTKDPHVESYSMDDIEGELGLDREKLVGLGLLLGCDYLPKGVPGVGKEMAVKFMQAMADVKVLDRFRVWRTQPADIPVNSKKPVHCSVCGHPGKEKEHERSGCALCGSDNYCEPCDYDYRCTCAWHQKEAVCSSAEMQVRRRARAVQGFPHEKIVKEFLISKDKKPTSVFKWLKPKLSKLQIFNLKKLEWPEDYTRDKVLPLVTVWDMKDILKSGKTYGHMVPISIVKCRVRQGIPCYEVTWEKLEEDVLRDVSEYTTIEEQGLVLQCFPLLVKRYETIQQEKKASKKSKKKGKKTQSNSQPEEQDDVERLASDIQTLNIKEGTCENTNTRCYDTQTRVTDSQYMCDETENDVAASTRSMASDSLHLKSAFDKSESSTSVRQQCVEESERSCQSLSRSNSDAVKITRMKSEPSSIKTSHGKNAGRNIVSKSVSDTSTLQMDLSERKNATCPPSTVNKLTSGQSNTKQSHEKNGCRKIVSKSVSDTPTALQTQTPSMEHKNVMCYQDRMSEGHSDISVWNDTLCDSLSYTRLDALVSKLVAPEVKQHFSRSHDEDCDSDDDDDDDFGNFLPLSQRLKIRTQSLPVAGKKSYKHKDNGAKSQRNVNKHTAGLTRSTGERVNRLFSENPDVFYESFEVNEKLPPKKSKSAIPLTEKYEVIDITADGDSIWEHGSISNSVLECAMLTIQTPTMKNNEACHNDESCRQIHSIKECGSHELGIHSPFDKSDSNPPVSFMNKGYQNESANDWKLMNKRDTNMSCSGQRKPFVSLSNIVTVDTEGTDEDTMKPPQLSDDVFESINDDDSKENTVHMLTPSSRGSVTSKLELGADSCVSQVPDNSMWSPQNYGQFDIETSLMNNLTLHSLPSVSLHDSFIAKQQKILNSPDVEKVKPYSDEHLSTGLIRKNDRCSLNESSNSMTESLDEPIELHWLTDSFQRCTVSPSSGEVDNLTGTTGTCLEFTVSDNIGRSTPPGHSDHSVNSDLRLSHTSEKTNASTAIKTRCSHGEKENSFLSNVCNVSDHSRNNEESLDSVIANEVSILPKSCVEKSYVDDKSPISLADRLRKKLHKTKNEKVLQAMKGMY